MIHFTRPAHPPCLTSDGARRGAEALFIHAVRPVMPQPQTDGSLQGGNLDVFESLLCDPVVLSPPRAETFVRRHIKPADGMWTQDSMEAARTVFAMAAVGLKFIIFNPIVTHRETLMRSPHFQVLDAEGRPVGVRDCCPHCRSNKFVNASAGKGGQGYNITSASDAKRNGVRFLYGLDGVKVPVSRRPCCRNPRCPKNLEILQKNKLSWPHADRQLPMEGKPQGRRARAPPAEETALHALC